MRGFRVPRKKKSGAVGYPEESFVRRTGDTRLAGPIRYGR